MDNVQVYLLSGKRAMYCYIVAGIVRRQSEVWCIMICIMLPNNRNVFFGIAKGTSYEAPKQ